MKFSKNSIEGLALPQGQDDRIVWDGELPCFGVRLRRSANETVTKSWRVQYRVGHQQRSQSLGDVRKVTLEDARKIARRVFAKVELGTDPAAERIVEQRIHEAAALTLGSVAERYLRTKTILRRNSLIATMRYLKTHWAPLHAYPLAPSPAPR